MIADGFFVAGSARDFGEFEKLAENFTGFQTVQQGIVIGHGVLLMTMA